LGAVFSPAKFYVVLNETVTVMADISDITRSFAVFRASWYFILHVVFFMRLPVITNL
jgi:hypothetical protein